MPDAPEFLKLSNSLWIWQAFEPAVKSDLFSSAVKTRGELFLVDPISLPAPLLEGLTVAGPVAAILVTNSNHPRAAASFAGHFGRPIFAAAEVPDEFESAERRAIPAEGPISPGVSAISIEGAAGGEVAFHFADDGGTIVMGDALINLEPYGFTFLPRKYCADHRQMRRSLRQLLDWPCERLLFAHGNPILAGARGRLETLLR